MELAFASAVANTVGAGCVQWLDCEGQQVVAFPSSTTVAVAQVGESGVRPQVICTMRGHKNRVNALACCHVTKELYSCGEDSTVRVWRKKHGLLEWSEAAVLQGLNASATTVACYSLEHSSYVVASDFQGNLCVWYCCDRRGDATYLLTQHLCLPPAQTPHALHIALLLASNGADQYGSLVLLVGSVDTRVHVYASSCPPAATFEAIGALPGHEEWVTSLASTRVGPDAVFVVSGSKDCKLRVWKFVSSPAGKYEGSGVEACVKARRGITQTPDSDSDSDEELDAPEGAVRLAAPEERASEARLVFRTSGAEPGSAAILHHVYLETLLLGHEDWVSAVAWVPVPLGQPPLLLSTSMDRNMVLWAPGTATGTGVGGDGKGGGVWTALARIGDVGGQLGGSVGNNLLGFVGGCAAPDGRAILGVGYGGSFHWWEKNASADSLCSTGLEVGQRWKARPFLTGHFGPVTSLAWAPHDGSYLMSVSSDQTARIWAPTVAQPSVDPHTQHRQWREVSRPQIHGYSLTGAVLLSATRAVTAGEEKLIRVFDMPRSVRRGLVSLCGIRIRLGSGGAKGSADGSNEDGEEPEEEPVEGEAERAYIPELGMSNRGIEAMSAAEAQQLQREAIARGVQMLDWQAGHPPLEGQLADLTVWPEARKLFGHSNDVLCLALSAPLCAKGGSGAENQSQGQECWLASACKARNAATASVLIWDMRALGPGPGTGTGTGTTAASSGGGSQPVAVLQGHESSVVALEFSGEGRGRFLASAGRDRKLCVYSRSRRGQGEAPYSLLAEQRDAHKRIVWALSWVPLSRDDIDKRNGVDESSSSVFLVTGSRDGACKVWQVCSEPQHGPALCCIHSWSPFGGIAVTALHCRLSLGRSSEPGPGAGLSLGGALVAVGSEAGDVAVWRLGDTEEVMAAGAAATTSAQLVLGVSDKWAHGAAVRSLRWRPSVAAVEEAVEVSVSDALLASGGDDNSVRIFRVPGSALL